MSAPQCTRLDDYLADALADDERATFEVHCQQCKTCQDELERQVQLDHLLAAVAAEPQPLPSGLAQRVEAYMKQQSWHRTRQFTGLWIAAAILLCVTAWFTIPLLNERSIQSVEPVAKVSAPTLQQLSADQTPQVRVTFTERSNVLAVPVKSQNPNITILWLYPTLKISTGEPSSNANPIRANARSS